MEKIFSFILGGKGSLQSLGLYALQGGAVDNGGMVRPGISQGRFLHHHPRLLDPWPMHDVEISPVQVEEIAILKLKDFQIIPFRKKEFHLRGFGPTRRGLKRIVKVLIKMLGYFLSLQR